MFKRKKNQVAVDIDMYDLEDLRGCSTLCTSALPEEGTYYADKKVRSYIVAMKTYINELERTKTDLERELEAIKPIVTHPDYKPAVSAECQACNYAAYSRWSGNLVGCRKHMLCEDFKRKED